MCPGAPVLFIVRIAESHDLHFIVGLVEQTAEGGGSNTADVKNYPIIVGIHRSETQGPFILIATRSPGNGSGGREVRGCNVRYHRTNTGGGEFNFFRVEAVVVHATDCFHAHGVGGFLSQAREGVGVTVHIDSGPFIFTGLVFEGVIFSIALPSDGGTIGGDIRNGHTVRCGTSNLIVTIVNQCDKSNITSACCGVT